MPKAFLVDQAQASGLGPALELLRGRQAAARKDVLLNEVGRAQVAREQGVVDHDALDAGLAAGFSSRCTAWK